MKIILTTIGSRGDIQPHIALGVALQENGHTVKIATHPWAKELIESHPDAQIDYISICDPDNLNDAAFIDGPVLMALAVKVGSTRLIDNMILKP